MEAVADTKTWGRAERAEMVVNLVEAVAAAAEVPLSEVQVA